MGKKKKHLDKNLLAASLNKDVKAILECIKAGADVSIGDYECFYRALDDRNISLLRALCSFEKKQQPSYKVVMKLGGFKSTADLLGISVASVKHWFSWDRPTPAIPQKHWPAIIAHSDKYNLKIKAEDLLHF